jgi:drug/metabolite transporter (DMT)-like permease
MIWVILTVVSVAIWGLADMLSKKGTEPEDPFSHIRFVICTGVAMLVFTPFSAPSPRAELLFHSYWRRILSSY